MTDEELRNILRLAVALALALPFGFASWWLIGSGWAVCDEAEAGARFGLTMVILPVLLGTGWAAHTGALFFGRRIPLPVRMLAATAVHAAICLGVIADMVPAYGEDFYVSSRPTAELPECGPRGIPTWWPDWLPS